MIVVQILLLVIFTKRTQCFFDIKNPYCRFKECCDSDWIPGDFKLLEREIEENVFGQHIVQQNLIPAIQSHFNPKIIPEKPLVLSFHGTPGTGKSFVSKKIARALYTNGLESKFVHIYQGRAEFTLDSDVKYYQEKLSKEIRQSISDCPRSLFIFDEVDKIPSGVFESLTSIVTHNIRGAYFSSAIFILISNTGGVELSNRLAELNKSGVLREQTELSHFEKLLTAVSYELDGGLKTSSLINEYAIDHYIPFLPLEKKHVYKCIEAQFNRYGVYGEKEEIEKLINTTVVFDPNSGLFATSGCKKLAAKVAVLATTKKNLPNDDVIKEKEL